MVLFNLLLEPDFLGGTSDCLRCNDMIRHHALFVLLVDQIFHYYSNILVGDIVFFFSVSKALIL